jgi:hypothetical protein
MKRAVTIIGSKHFYEVRPRKDKRGFDLVSDALPFGALWYVFARESQRLRPSPNSIRPYSDYQQ